MSDTRDFTIQVNINNLGPVDVMMDDPSPGPHMAEIVDVRQVTNDSEGGTGKTTLRFSVMDMEEAAKRPRAAMRTPAANQPSSTANGAANGGSQPFPPSTPSPSVSSTTVTRPPAAANSSMVIPEI